jgi:hypothetical protein
LLVSSSMLPPREEMCYGELCLGIVVVLLNVILKKRLEPMIKEREKPEHDDCIDPAELDPYKKMILEIVVPKLEKAGYKVRINCDGDFEVTDDKGNPLE